MAQQTILSTDNLPAGKDKINDNFDELYTDKDFLLNQTGWASYSDTGYTSLSPLGLSGGVAVPLPNRSQNIVEGQIPPDIKTFYCPVELTAVVSSGTFEEGEIITGSTSGATGTLKELTGGDTIFRITNLSGTFTNGETITGGTSGAIAGVASQKKSIITGRNGDNLDVMIYFKATPSAINSSIDVWVEIGGAVGELYRQTILFRDTTTKGVLYSLPSAYTLGTWEANGGVIYVQPSVDMTVYGLNFNFDRSHKAR